MSKTSVVIPHSEETFERYYDLRWRVLRKPFKRPRGSEKDEYDQVGEHRMLVNSKGEAIGVGRIHFNSPEEAQIRFMAVDPKVQGEGHGVNLIYALESAAKEQGAERVIINSRENTLGFYIRCGYELKEEADTVKNPQAEHQLVKALDKPDYIVYRPTWCEDLQNVWHKEIPITEAMGIRIYQYTGRTFELRAPLARNINVHQTMFAGSIYTLATLAGWGMIQLHMQEENIEGGIVLADANIEYKMPVESEPRAISTMSDMEGDFTALQQGKNAHLTLTVAVYDGDDFAAMFTGHYVVKAKR
ncbi:MULTISPECIES: bifunctional GNAT family N-acetyltransferase/hotdog fold thioesterase [Gammaproteobacteria]|uniref:bifunctional GNAT family N-acetyltransferase/hotdog fold thioesterase n=1 Tax=Gammaproteobacteria TaxID=1236 RepID=UPI000DCFEA70|nr:MULTISPECIES: bifunctional GNAT family N-acetyltransferase/hotdog fold thioesterase [Gammaproteobacteria]RTE85898.1 GNAT family N-acetyltransferase [Aliidiomarina sp. B3213]TCZ90102.1 GNAT family N-acetyltransferase [Lysobacter sp. N42]